MTLMYVKENLIAIQICMFGLYLKAGLLDLCVATPLGSWDPFIVDASAHLRKHRHLHYNHGSLQQEEL